MKTSTVACVLMMVAAVALIASPAFAAPISMRDSADFNYNNVFEGDSSCIDGTNTAWTHINTGVDAADYSSDGDVVTWTTGYGDQFSWAAAATSGWATTTDPTKGFTVEFRFQINSQASSGTAMAVSPMSIAASGGGGRADLFVSSTGAVQRQNTGSGVTYNYLTTGDNDDDYHVFRIVRDAAGKDYYYKDGELISDVNGVIGLEQVSPETLLSFGDASASGSNYTGSVSLDYVRYDTTGAYAPVPEPSTIALLVTGLIGLLAYAWRKRK